MPKILIKVQYHVNKLYIMCATNSYFDNWVNKHLKDTRVLPAELFLIFGNGCTKNVLTITVNIFDLLSFYGKLNCSVTDNISVHMYANRRDVKCKFLPFPLIHTKPHSNNETYCLPAVPYYVCCRVP